MAAKEFSPLTRDIVEYIASALKASDEKADMLLIVATRREDANGEKQVKVEMSSSVSNPEAIRMLLRAALTQAQGEPDFELRPGNDA